MPIEVGAARVQRVEEQRIDLPIAAFTGSAGWSPADAEAFVAERLAPLPVGFLDPDTAHLQFCFQSWVIQVDGATILVDPCNGNGRQRGNLPFFDDLDTPYLQRLTAIGVPPEAVDFVYSTHLHNDHFGWNTQSVDGMWVPTFPNAVYLFVDREYARWNTDTGPNHPNDYNANVFDECVRPVVEAGLARIVELPYDVSPSVRIEAANGHTVGHSMLVLSSNSELAYFVGDCLHHPAQIFAPELHLSGCDDLDEAIATRRRVFGRVSADQALIMPAHFPEPHFGRVVAEGDSFVFRPGAGPAPAD